MKKAGKMVLTFVVAMLVGSIFSLLSGAYGSYYKPLCWEQRGNCSGTTGCDPQTEFCGHISPTSDACGCLPLP